MAHQLDDAKDKGHLWQVDLHDWSLRDLLVRFSHDRQSHDVLLRVGEPARSRDEMENDIVKQHWILFKEVRGIRVEMDLIAKSLSSNTISSEHHASVSDEPELADRLDAMFKEQLSPDLPDRTDMIRFHICLCPPSGSIEVLAKTAIMREITDADGSAKSLLESLGS